MPNTPLSLLETIIASLPGNVYWKDKQGKLLGCNLNMAKMAGYDTPDALIGMTDYELPWRAIADELERNDDIVIATGKEHIFREIGMDAQGKYHVMHSQKTPLKNEKGETIGLLGISTEITGLLSTSSSMTSHPDYDENKQLIASIYERVTGQTQSAEMSTLQYVETIRDYLEKIISLMPGNVYWKTTEGMYLGCNDNQAKAFHLPSRHDVFGKNDRELMKDDSLKSVLENDAIVIKSNQGMIFEEVGQDEMGKTVTYLSHKVPLNDAKNQIIGILGVSLDITHQKEIEEDLRNASDAAKKANRSKTEFIRNMSHDIRTPLAGIQQTSRAISEGKIPECEIPEYARAMWEASNNLLDLFNKIIDVSKKEQFDFEDQIVKFDLFDLIQNIETTYCVIAKHKNVALIVDCTSDVPRYLVGKHFRLHRILMNLIGNAMKFTSEGSVQLLVELAKSTEQQAILRFSIIDTGIGIPEEKQHFIFEPFTRLTPTSTGQYPGSGLGLHVVKEYVDKMGGEIHVESEEGHGSIFSCILPFKRPILDNDNDVVNFLEPDVVPLNDIVSPHKPLPLHAKSAAVTPTLSNKRVLLVEDYALAQNMGHLILTNMGYTVDVVSCGEDALEKANTTAYDFIYLDIGLPGIDGIETARRIRQARNSPNANTYIIALTAHADEGITEQCLQAGMQEVIAKPLSPEQVAAIHHPNADGVINFPLWQSRLGNNKDKVKDFFELLAEQLPQDKAELTAAYEARDIEKLKMVTHKMKGGLKYCGCPTLEAAVIALEQAVKENNQSAIEQFYPDTLVAIEDVLNAYEAFSK